MFPLTINNLVNQSDTQNVVLHEKEVLLKSLIGQVATSNPTILLQGTEQIVNEVIFESDIDGVHYYLVRCRTRSSDQIKLSPREQAIAKLVAQGLSNKSIANLLHISPWTVATHLRRIFVKLGVTSRTAMITRLLEENLLQE
ncbi:LuxR C-terminal-related transcriptional regulator [Chroococcidiopsis sp. CCMEE 29]|uniref:response regulator transcription factor n=1 Tax=Chroococcidiopsis sp. CCMEE 29 TaxID=155894 RepID=UPI0020203B0D|nr:LuxR C-terminal-related transcriptional regulator [Chroococcidiopsis sp. CCMEE 29]